jgi:hypothetical protein
VVLRVHRVLVADKATKDCRVRRVQAVQQVHRVLVADKATKDCRVRRAQAVPQVHRVLVVDKALKVQQVHKVQPVTRTTLQVHVVHKALRAPLVLRALLVRS